MQNQDTDVIEQLGTAMTSGLDKIYDLGMAYSDVLMKTSQLICGIAALLYIGSKLWNSWAKGEPIDFYSMLRPFATGLLIVFFSGFVYLLDVMVRPVLYATEYVRGTATEEVSVYKTEYDRAVREMRDKKAQYERSRPEEEKEQLGVWKSINRSLLELKDSVLGAFESCASFVFKLLVELTAAGVNLLLVAVFYFYKIYVVTAKIILVLIGPFVLALSVFPGFHSNLKAWITHYVNVSLYIPVCNIIGFVQSVILCECFYKPFAETFDKISASVMSEDVIVRMDGAVTMSNVSGIMLGLVAIMLYACVPFFAKCILQDSGCSAKTSLSCKSQKQ